jgi:hypothetical protein
MNMTPTDRAVTRVTIGEYPSRTGITGRGYGRPRKIATTIGPGDDITLRWGGTRQRYTLSIEQLIRRAEFLEQRERQAQRRARKKGTEA